MNKYGNSPNDKSISEYFVFRDISFILCKDLEIKTNPTSKDLILDTFLLYEKFCIASTGHGK